MPCLKVEKSLHGYLKYAQIRGVSKLDCESTPILVTFGWMAFICAWNLALPFINLLLKYIQNIKFQKRAGNVLLDVVPLSGSKAF